MKGLAEGWIELKDAAAKYNRSPATLRQAIRAGRLPADLIGHTLIVEDAVVDAYVRRTDGYKGRPPGSKDRVKSARRGRPRKQPDQAASAGDTLKGIDTSGQPSVPIPLTQRVKGDAFVNISGIHVGAARGMQS